MHLDMARELESDAEADRVKQQASLNVWVGEFNNERPHEALGMRVPCEVYRKSSRIFDPTPIQLVYPSHCEVRKVATTGCISVNSMNIMVSRALAGLQVGLESIGDNRYSLWFCRLLLGEVDLTTASFRKLAGT
jgi:hypothetical protein